MEHAFLDTIPDIPSHRFGEKGREARRIRGEVMAMRLTDRYIHDHLPGLLANPPMPVGSTELLKYSKALFDHLAEHTSCYRELAAGYNRFCRFITAGNEAGAWSYPAIAKAHELPTQPLLRDAEWQRYSILVHKIDQELQRKIAVTTASQLDDAEMLIGLLRRHVEHGTNAPGVEGAGTRSSQWSGDLHTGGQRRHLDPAANSRRIGHQRLRRRRIRSAGTTSSRSGNAQPDSPAVIIAAGNRQKGR